MKQDSSSHNRWRFYVAFGHLVASNKWLEFPNSNSLSHNTNMTCLPCALFLFSRDEAQLMQALSLFFRYFSDAFSCRARLSCCGRSTRLCRLKYEIVLNITKWLLLFPSHPSDQYILRFHVEADRCRPYKCCGRDDSVGGLFKLGTHVHYPLLINFSMSWA